LFFLQISKSSDYDVLFVLKDVRTESIYWNDTGVAEKYYSKLRAKNVGLEDFEKILSVSDVDSGSRYISPVLLLEYFRGHIKEAVKTIESQTLKITS